MEEILKELRSRIEWVPSKLGAAYYINTDVALFVGYDGCIELLIFEDGEVTQHTIDSNIQTMQQVEEIIDRANRFFNSHKNRKAED